ncbi:hypothetical protein DMB44_05095 [Thermoplasma sp. Kam2015]|nr:hypothetical protein DMB44_05095 [Thermoplasma sp. Kam2015]
MENAGNYYGLNHFIRCNLKILHINTAFQDELSEIGYSKNKFLISTIRITKYRQCREDISIQKDKNIGWIEVKVFRSKRTCICDAHKMLSLGKCITFNLRLQHLVHGIAVIRYKSENRMDVPLSIGIR